MSGSTLRQVLTLFEGAREPLSIKGVARTLDVSPEQVESMLDYWVRKGRLRANAAQENCGTCGSQGSCPFVIDLPNSYELVREDELLIPLTEATCSHKTKQ